MATTTKGTDGSVRDWPAYWFVALERAIADGDTDAADKARAELRRLGYTVSVSRHTSEGHADD